MIKQKECRMKYTKIFMPIIIATQLLYTVPVYATQIEIPDIETNMNTVASSDEEATVSEESIYDSFTEIGMKDTEGNVLVYVDEKRHIFFDEEYNYYFDENGTVEYSDVIALGIAAEESTVETLAEARMIQLNINTDFENFALEESNIYNIYVSVTGEPRYVNEEEKTVEYANVLLSRDNEFSMNVPINCTDKTFIVTCKIADEVNAYRISIDEEEYGYKEYSAEASSYDITLHVTLPEGSITDTNLAPSLSETDKKYIDGSYGESRREELKESLEQESNPEQPEQPEEKESKLLGIIILSSIIGIIIIGAGAIYLWRKKIEED